MVSSSIYTLRIRTNTIMSQQRTTWTNATTRKKITLLKPAKLATGDSQDVCEMQKISEMRHVCMGYFVFFMLLHETDFSCLAPRTVLP